MSSCSRRASVILAVVVSALLLATLTLVGRQVWDADYQAREGALIGVYVLVFVIAGLVGGVVIAAMVDPLPWTGVVATVVVDVLVVLVVGSVGEGFLGFRVGGMVLGIVIATPPALAGVGAVTLVRSAARRLGAAMGSGGGGR